MYQIKFSIIRLSGYSLYFIINNIRVYQHYNPKIRMASPGPLFPLALSYPSFFNTNLLDPSRIIKLVEGRHSAIRIFYYQLLKLIFEIDAARESGEEVDYMAVLEGLMGDVVAKSAGGGGDGFVRRCVEDVGTFMRGMAKTGELQFQPYLDRNPEADAAFVGVLVEVLRQANLENASVEEILGYLSSLFELRVNQIDKCIKFEQSDVFVYIQNPNKLYLAFLNLEQAQPQPQPQKQNSIDKGIYHNRVHTHYRQQKEFKKLPNKANNDTIINIFGDMLHSSKNEGDSKNSNSFITNNLNSSLSPGKREEEVLTSMKGNGYGSSYGNSYGSSYGNGHVNGYVNGYVNGNGKGGKYNFGEEEKKQQKYDYAKTSDDSKFIKNESRVQKYLPSNPNPTNAPKTRQPQSSPSPDNTLYRPPTKLPTISQVTSSKQSVLYSHHRNKRDPLDILDDEEKGTFYRQFTNTRILNILPEPQRTNVKMLRNRFIGVHGRDLGKR